MEFGDDWGGWRRGVPKELLVDAGFGEVVLDGEFFGGEEGGVMEVEGGVELDGLGGFGLLEGPGDVVRPEVGVMGAEN